MTDQGSLVASPPSSTKVKVILGKDIRLIWIPLPPRFGSLLSLIQKQFQIDNCRITTLDDEDETVTVSDTPSLVEILCSSARGYAGVPRFCVEPIPPLPSIPPASFTSSSSSSASSTISILHTPLPSPSSSSSSSCASLRESLDSLAYGLSFAEPNVRGGGTLLDKWGSAHPSASRHDSDSSLSRECYDSYGDSKPEVDLAHSVLPIKEAAIKPSDLLMLPYSTTATTLPFVSKPVSFLGSGSGGMTTGVVADHRSSSACVSTASDHSFWSSDSLGVWRSPSAPIMSISTQVHSSTATIAASSPSSSDFVFPIAPPSYSAPTSFFAVASHISSSSALPLSGSLPFSTSTATCSTSLPLGAPLSTPLPATHPVLVDDVVATPTASFAPDSSTAIRECIQFARSGACPRGTFCTFKHSPRENRPCKYFLRGRCVSDGKCEFSHSKDWLPASSSSSAASPKVSVSLLSSPFECALCGKHFTGVKQKQQHEEGREHKHNLTVQHLNSLVGRVPYTGSNCFNCGQLGHKFSECSFGFCRFYANRECRNGSDCALPHISY